MSIETEAWARVPGHDDSDRIRRAAGITTLPPQHLPAVPYRPKEQDARAAVEAEVRRLLRAGETVPGDIAQSIIDAQQADALGLLRSTAMSQVVRAAADRQLQPQSINAALDYLRDLLDMVAGEVTVLAPNVSTLASADDAIKSHAVDEWRRLGELATEYAEIRRVQQALSSAALRNSVHTFSSAEFERSALFADALTWHPAWTARRAEVVRTEAGSGPLPQAVRDYQQWLRAGLHDSDVLNGLVPPERRLILVFTQHRPWIPTVAQWHAVDDLLQSVTTAPTQESVAQVEALRQEALRILGDDQKLPDPQRLPFADRDVKPRYTNVSRAGLSISQIRDIGEAQRSQDAAQEFLASRRARTVVPTE
jgi:hypothetical protein